MSAQRLPETISEYLAQLRAALAGADPALVQDALYDAEEYLRGEMAANPASSEAQVVAAVASSYGAPEEVAEIYRETEATVQSALRAGPMAARLAPSIPADATGAGSVRGDAPPQPPLYQGSLLRRVFGVFVDPRTWGALFYMLLALATGIFYFTWTVAGMGLSLGLAVLVIGLPFFLLFIAASRVIALVEGRIVEAMLGERMPRRAPFADASLPLLTRVGRMLSDPHTWSALLYFVLLLPLGIAYFTTAVTGLCVSLALLASPFVAWLGRGWGLETSIGSFSSGTGIPEAWAWPLIVLAGLLLLLLTLHGARLLGRAHGKLAKALLVEG